MSERLRIRRAVRVLQSTVAQVPLVVGYLRPVILLPVSFLTHLPTEQLEAILAHELAHVRRHDFVVNLLQTMVETLFFYHPAVWWLSSRIRIEREHCCDDLVVTVLENHAEYGRALVAVEELRGQTSVLTLAASDGSLLSRIRRIAGVQPAGNLSSVFSLYGAGLLCLLVFVACVVATTGPGLAQQAADVEQETPLPPQNEKLGTINVRIVNEDGSKPTVKGYTFRHVKFDGGNSLMNAEGKFVDRFTIQQAAGRVWFVHFADGFAPAFSEPVHVRPGEEREVTLILKPGTTASLKLRDEEGQPIVGAGVKFYPEFEGASIGTATVGTTGQKGEILLEHVADMAYRLSARVPGFEPIVRQQVHVVEPEDIVLTMTRSKLTSGVVRNAAGAPAVGATLRAMVEVYQGGANFLNGNGPGNWGEIVATPDAQGRFVLDQLSDDLRRLFIVETADGARAIVHDLECGQENVEITVPERRDLVVRIKGDISQLADRHGSRTATVQQHIEFKTAIGNASCIVGGDATIEVSDDGGTAMFRGLAVDLSPDQKAQQKVHIQLGSGDDLRQTADLNLLGDTRVEFTLAEKEVGSASAAPSVETSVGKIQGRIILKGEIPPRPPLKVLPNGLPNFGHFPSAEQRAKKAAAMVEVEDRSLLVDMDGGLENAFVYLREPPAGFKRLPNASQQATVEIRDFHTIHPRAQIVPVGWDLKLLNKHDHASNLRITPLWSESINPLILPGEDFLCFVMFQKAEPVPTILRSDTLMTNAWVLAVDHPFAAISDKEGRFEIPDLPPGEHTFSVWHERVGFLPELKVAVQSGQKTVFTHSVPADRFVEKETSLPQTPMVAKSAATQETLKAVGKSDLIQRPEPGERSGPSTVAGLTEDTLKIRGRWHRKMYVYDGEIKPARLDVYLVVTEDDRLENHVLFGEAWEFGSTVVGNRFFRIDSSKLPMSIDATGHPDWTDLTKGIVRISGDRLTLCYAKKGQPRPTQFGTGSGAGGGNIMEVYERVKDTDYDFAPRLLTVSGNVVAADPARRGGVKVTITTEAFRDLRNLDPNALRWPTQKIETTTDVNGSYTAKLMAVAGYGADVTVQVTSDAALRGAESAQLNSWPRKGMLAIDNITLQSPAAAFYDQASQHHAAKRFDKALADYAKAIELDPDFNQAYFSRHSLLA